MTQQLPSYPSQFRTVEALAPRTVRIRVREP